MIKLAFKLLLLFLFCSIVFGSQAQTIRELQTWLNQDYKTRSSLENQPFAGKALRKREVGIARQLLLDDQKKFIKTNWQKEWQQKQFTSGEYTFKFEYKTFGKMPADGRSLYISLHGGGGTTKQVNDQQWRNQINLYTPAEGIYVAPRAPTDTWNLWHQDHIDAFLDKLIQAAIVFEGVNPNKVYITGYSAGGDGTFQLAPRLADRWAAAAMMAGHPGDAVAGNLRNIGFAIQMGGKDAAYNRNGLAKKWEILLDSLQKTDPAGYTHLVNIYPDKPHWMSRLDTVAVKWMAQFKRKPLPNKIYWEQDDVLKSRFYWLEVSVANAKQHQKIIATYTGNEIEILTSDYDTFMINLNDQMMDLNKPILLKQNGKIIFEGKVKRKLAHLQKSIESRIDPDLVFSTQIVLSGGKVTSY